MEEARLVLPGEVIFDNPESLMPGNGVCVEDGKIIATIRGYVTQDSQLVYVTPLASIYTPNKGDIVIGRIDQVLKQKWKVDIGTYVLADLRLTAIFLPEGDQKNFAFRRRTTEDERNMRKYFDVGDVICAAIQDNQNSVMLHTLEKYPMRLDKGVVVEVPSRLIKRVKDHIVVLNFYEQKFNCVFGLNGSIWLSPANPEEEEALATIPRIRNCIILLGTYEQPIYPESVSSIFNKTLEIPVADILTEETAKKVGFLVDDDSDNE